MGTLYIVATPIGNLGDITLRAIETFKAVSLIAAEDTRHTLELLNYLGISKPLVSCRAHNEAMVAPRLIEALKLGDVAYASDAGTPGLSDPGALLVEAVRRSGYSISPIPGASAFSALVSVAGVGGKSITMEGFLSPKAGRRHRRLQELIGRNEAFIVYESPYRIVKLLCDIADIDSGRRVVVGRELTKMHEEIIAGKAGELYSDFAKRESVRGEFAVFISGLEYKEHNV